MLDFQNTEGFNQYFDESENDPTYYPLDTVLIAD